MKKSGTTTPARGDVGSAAAASEPAGRGWVRRIVAVLKTDPGPGQQASKWGPFALVGLAVAFNLWVLRAEALPVHQLNDGAVHQAMIRWALTRIQSGHLPFDGWFPNLGLGSSLFHHYQSLPHIATAYLSLIVGADRAYSGTLYLLLASWPISVYWGARLLGWERWPAAAAALLSPLLVSVPGYGYEHGSYTWRGLGVWSQLWAMWLLPIAWGLSWRVVSGRSKKYAIAALLVGLVAACHFITGYMALLVLPIWVLIKPSEFLVRLKRAAVVGIGGLLIVSWVVVPLLLDSKFSTQSQYSRGTFWFDSFGAGKVFGWLFRGQLFDGSAPSRLPVVSFLVALGAVVCVTRFRSDERARVLLLAMALGLFLFSGRPTFGFVLGLLPGSGDLLLHRFIMGVHLAGVLLAGVGVGWIAGLVRRLLPRFSGVRARLGMGVAVLGVMLLALAPAWTERARFDLQGDEWIHTQRSFDATDGANIDALVAEANALGPGRMFAGRSDGWGTGYRVWSVAVFEYILNSGADDVGFLLRTTSLSTDVEVLFDETNPAHYSLFNVRYLILPPDRQPSVPATPVDTKGGNTLWLVNTGNYLGVVDALPPIAADRTNLAQRVEPFMQSSLPAEGRFPTIAFAGTPGAPATLPPGAASSRPAGTVDFEFDALENGVVRGEIDAARPAMVMLKESFDPRWTVQVDGRSLPTQMIAPSFVGREVPAGRHTIVFAYHPFPRYDLLAALGVLTFAGLQWVPALLPLLLSRRTRRGRRPGRKGGADGR